MGQRQIRVTAIIGNVIRITHIKSLAGAGRPAEDELGPNVFIERGVIEPQPGEYITIELIGRTRTEDIVVECYQARVVSFQTDLVVVQPRLESAGGLITGRGLYHQLITRAGIKPCILSKVLRRIADPRKIRPGAQI